MLGKLLKYEFRSTARVFLPMYAILIGFAILNRFTIAGMENALFSDNDFLEFISGTAIFGYIMVIFSVLIITFVIIVQRFYKNLTGDEGYLMHTLPVSTHKLIQAKIITAFVWQMASAVTIILSVFILLLQPWFLRDFAMFWHEFMQALGELFAMIGWGSAVANIVTILAAMVISGVTSILMIYASISIGHTFKKHRIMGSVVSYIGLMMIGQVIIGLVGGSFSWLSFGTESIPYYAVTPAYISEQVLGVVGIAALIELGLGAAWYFVTHHVLTSQLNLE